MNVNSYKETEVYLLVAGEDCSMYIVPMQAALFERNSSSPSPSSASSTVTHPAVTSQIMANPVSKIIQDAVSER